MRLLKTSITNTGSMLIEVCLAISLFSIFTAGIASYIFQQQSFIIDLQYRRQALFQAHSHMEMLQANAQENILSLHNASSTNNNIALTTTISYPNPCLTKATSSAQWNTSGKIKTIAFSLLFHDRIYDQAIDHDCGSFTLPSFETPLLRQPINATTTAFDVYDNTLYIGTSQANTSSLFIYSYNDGAITQRASIPLDAPIVALDAIHNAVFIAVDNTHHQFQIVDTHDIDAPSIIASSTLPGVTGSYPGATSIRYYNNKVYIGTHRTAGHEFHIYDVSNRQPHWLSSRELNHNINSISIREPFIYLATSGNTKDLIILDAQNPSSIKQISTLELPGAQDALSLFLTGNTLYLGKKKSTKITEPNFVIIDISSSTLPKLIGSTLIQKNIVDLKTIHTTAILAAQDTTSHVEFLDISDPHSIQQIRSLPLTGKLISIDSERPYMYVLEESNLSIY